MSTLHWAPAIGATAVVVVMLAGCSPSPGPPRPATAEEIQALREAQARNWWDTFADGAPMPVVEVIEVLPAEESYERQLQCITDAAIPGVTVMDGGGVHYEGDGGYDDPWPLALEQQYWLCAQQYPVGGEDEYILSTSELAWLYDFYLKRYQPCLGSLGFEFLDFPEREQFIGDAAGYPAWVPHDYSVAPVPTRDQWTLIAERCPLPELLDRYELPGFGPFG